MSIWTALVIIVAIWALVQFHQNRQEAASGIVRDEDGNPIGNPRRERELQAEIAKLRERLEVLERIATDDRESRRLSAEIEELRDQQEHQPTGRGE